MEFATNYGLILKLGPHEAKHEHDYLAMKFECAVFSDFPEEKETLFFGGDTKLKIEGIIQWARGKWRHYDKYMEPINAFNHLIHGLPLKGQAILTTKKRSKKLVLDLMSDLLRPLLLDCNTNDTLDFAAMSGTVDIGESVLEEGLKDYQQDSDRLIGDLIDVVYGEEEEEEKMEIWNKLKVEDDRKQQVFRDLLHVHFDCIQLNSENFLKICDKMVRRLLLQINVHELVQNMNTDDLDDAFSNNEKFVDLNSFKELFKSRAEYNESDIEALHKALSEWKYVERNKYAVDMCQLAKQVVDEWQAGKATEMARKKANEFGPKIIDFFSENRDIDGNALYAMDRKDFCQRLAEFCGSKKIKGEVMYFFWP